MNQQEKWNVSLGEWRLFFCLTAFVCKTTSTVQFPGAPTHPKLSLVTVAALF